MTYAFFYKCRLCGETFEEGRTGSDNIAFDCTISAALNQPATRLYVQAPSLVGTHITSTHYGVADFVGAEQIEETCPTCANRDGYPESEICKGCKGFNRYARGGEV